VGVVSSRNQDGSDPRAYFVRSADGLTWRRTSLTFRASVRGLVVGLDGSALAVGAVGGTPLADGSPTEDMLAWRSDDGRIWTGPQLVAHEAGPFAASAGPDGDGLVALVRTPERSPGGTLNDATQLWLLLEGTAPRITTFPLREGEYLSSVFVLGRTVLAIGAGETGAMVWVSTDGGETFGRVADQPSLVANSTDFTGLVEVPGGALAVGRSWDEFTGHPVPLAWLADR
jgi:photosystem II stability/assembly factor-like uncharacterized protein